MTSQPPRRTRALAKTAAHAIGAACLSIALGLASIAGAGMAPPLGELLTPGTGVWRLPEASADHGSERVSVPGLETPAVVSFDEEGLAFIDADADTDLFRAIGYLHASHRLFQMEMSRRQAGGTLAEVVGPEALDSDRFQRDLGLARAAQRDWRAVRGDAAGEVLEAYADGVNAVIGQARESGRLPTAFKVLGHEPEPWSPVDSLLMQRAMTQTLSYNDHALTFAGIAEALPEDTFDAWFPAVPANSQHPYDPGPYEERPLAPLPVRADDPPGADAVGPRPEWEAFPDDGPAPTADVEPLLERLASLPPGSVHREVGNSNAWAVSGDRTRSGGPLLAGDPHLPQQIPGMWYQVVARGPGYRFTGATIPGIPVPLIGQTEEISWTVTNAQHPSTLYYVEATDPERPGEYRWRGRWRPMETVEQQIEVRGLGTVEHETRFTAHGPVLAEPDSDDVVSVWWAGALASDNVTSILRALRAEDAREFRDSFRDWRAPAVNIVYASRAGDIGALMAGVVPQVGGGASTSLPLPGDGSADVAGTVPFESLPAADNPQEGFVVSANQREVAADYPYAYSSSFNYPAMGWRAERIAEALSAEAAHTTAISADLQADHLDVLARDLTPHLLDALEGQELTGLEQEVAEALAAWDHSVGPESRLALFSEAFVDQLVHATFQPWWEHYAGPGADPDGGGLGLSPDGGSWAALPLRATLLRWLEERGDDEPHLGLPAGGSRDAEALLREAFSSTVRRLGDEHGHDLDAWRFSEHHARLYFSMTQVPALDEGPFPAGGNDRTVNAAVGALLRDGEPLEGIATAGPTYRFLVDWGEGSAQAMAAGGQSEDPLSEWYRNGFEPFLDGQRWDVSLQRALEAPAAEWELVP